MAEDHPRSIVHAQFQHLDLHVADVVDKAPRLFRLCVPQGVLLLLTVSELLKADQFVYFRLGCGLVLTFYRLLW